MADALSYKDLYTSSHLNQYSATGYVEELTRNKLEKPTLASKILGVETATEKIKQDAITDYVNKQEMKRTRPMPVSYESQTIDRDLDVEKAFGYENIPAEKKYRTTAEELSGLTLGIVSPSTVQKGLSSTNMLLDTLKGQPNEVEKSWFRPDGTYKGPGWLGDVGDDKETVTEKSISVSFDGKETLIPSIVPSSTPEEIKLIRAGKITPEITQKAISFAKTRMAEGKSPFKEWNEDNPWVNLPETTQMPNILPVVKELGNAIPTILKKDTIPVVAQFATAIGNYMIDVAPTEPMGLFDGAAMSKKILGIPELPKDEITSKFQNWMNKKNEAIQEQKSKWDEGSIGSYAQQAYQSIGMQVPAYAVGILGKNPNISLGIMYATSAGNATQAYIDKGVDHDTAVAAGKLEGHFEWMTEVVPTGFMFKAMKSSLPKNLLKMSLNDVGFEQINSGMQQIVQDVTTGVTPDSHSLELYKSTLITTVAQMGVMSGVATTVNKLQSIPASIDTINKINKERERIVEENNRRISQLNALGLISQEDAAEQRQSIPDVTKTPWETFKAMSKAYAGKVDVGAVGPDITREETNKAFNNLLKQKEPQGGLPYKKTPEREFLDSLKPYVNEIMHNLSGEKWTIVEPTLEQREQNTLLYYDYITGMGKGSKLSDVYKTLYGEDYAEAIKEFNKTANRYSISESEKIAQDTFRHFFGKGLYERPFYTTETMDESIPANYTAQVMATDGSWSAPKEVTYLQKSGDNFVISVNDTIQTIPSSNIAFIKNVGDTTLPTLESKPLTFEFVGNNPNTLFISTDKTSKTKVNKALGKRVDNMLTLDINPSDENFTENQIEINEKIRQIKSSLFKRKFHPQMSYNVKSATFQNMQNLLSRDLPVTLFRRGVDEGDIVEINNEDGRSELLRVTNVEYRDNEEVPYAFKNGKPTVVKDSPIAKRKLTLRKVTGDLQSFTDVHTSINIGKSLQTQAPKTYQYLLSEIYNLKRFSDTIKKLRDSALTDMWVDDETITTTDYDINQTAIRKSISKVTKEEVTQRKVSVIKEYGVAPDGNIIYQTTGGLYSAHGRKYIDNKETGKLQRVKQTLKAYGQPAPFQENDYVYGRNNFISAILAGTKQSLIMSTDKAKNLEVGDLVDIVGSMKAAQVKILKIDRNLKEQLDIAPGPSGYLEVGNTKLRDEVTLTEGLTNYLKAKTGKVYYIPGHGILKMFTGPKAPFAKVNATRIVFEVIPKIEKKTRTSLVKTGYDISGMRKGTKNISNTTKEDYGKKDSGWLGNPYIATDVRGGTYTRKEATELFKRDFLRKIETDEDFKNAVEDLRGKKIGYYKPDEKDIHLNAVLDYLYPKGNIKESTRLTPKEFSEVKKYEVTDNDREFNFVYGKMVEAISQNRRDALDQAVNYGVKLGLFPMDAVQSIIDNAISDIEEKPAYKTFINYVTGLGAEMTSFMKVSEPAEAYLPDVAIGQGNVPGPGTKNVAPTMFQDPDTAFLGESFTQVFPFKEGGREVLVTGSDLQTHYIRHHDSVRDELNKFILTDGASGLSPKSELAASHFFIYPDLYREFGKDSLINEKLKNALEADLQREKSVVPSSFELATDQDMRMLDADPTAINRLAKEMRVEFSDEETVKQEEFVNNVTSAYDNLKDTDITVDDIKDIGKPTRNFKKGERGSIAVMPPWLFKAVAKAFSSGKADQKSPLVKMALNLLPSQEAMSIVSEYFGGASESLENYLQRAREHEKFKVIKSGEEYECRGTKYYVDVIESGETTRENEYWDTEYAAPYIMYGVFTKVNGKTELVDTFYKSSSSLSDAFFGAEEKSLDESAEEIITALQTPFYADDNILSGWKKKNHISYDPKDIWKNDMSLIHYIGKYFPVDIDKMLDDMVSLKMFYLNGKPIPVQISSMTTENKSLDISKGNLILFSFVTPEDIVYAGRKDLYTSRPDPDQEEYDRLPSRLEYIEKDLSYLKNKKQKDPHDELVVNLRPGNFYLFLEGYENDPRVKEINSWAKKKPVVKKEGRFSAPFKMSNFSSGERGSIEVPFQDVAIRLRDFFKRLHKNEDYNRFSQEDLDRLNAISAAVDKVNINIVDYLDTASRMGLTIEEFLENMYTGQGIQNADKLAAWTMNNIVDPKVFEYIYQDAVDYLYDKAENREKTTTFVERVADLAKEKKEKTSEYVEYKAAAFENMMSNLTFFGEAPEEFKIEVANLYASIRDLSMERARIDSMLWKKLSRKDKKIVVSIVSAKDSIARIRRYNLDKIGGKGLEYWVAVLRNITNGTKDREGLLDMEPARAENIKSAVAAWGSMNNVLFNDLKARGMASDIEHMSDYAPYFAYDPSFGVSKRAIKSSLKRYFVMPEKLKEPQYNYLKEVHGTDKPRLLTPEMMTDFIVSVRHDMLVSEAIKKICDMYDKKRDMSDFERSKWGQDEFGNDFENPPVTNMVININDINYVVYSPEDFSFNFSLDPNTNREYKSGNARSYLIPEKIAGYLNEMTNTPGAVMRGMNAFVRAWKRSIIYTIFPSFNWNNSFGDFQMYLMTHPNKRAAVREINPAFSFAVKYFKEQAGKQVVYNTHERRLKDFVDRYKTIESSQMVTDLTALDDVNILKHVAKMFNKISTFRESILRVAVASYLVREIDYGRGEEIKNTYKFMNIDPKLNYIEFAGRVSQDAMINYLRQSPTYRKWITGCLMPWGHFYFQGTKLFYKWLAKGDTPLERMTGFGIKSALLTTPSLLANLWNQGFISALMGDDDDAQKKKRMEMRLHQTIRNRFHLIIGDKVWVPQIVPDILMGTKIYSIIGNKSLQLLSGEINVKQFTRDTIKEWSLAEGKSMAYLLNPLVRYGIGFFSGKDPLDGSAVYPEFNKTRLETDEQLYYAGRYFVKTMNTVFSSYVAAHDNKGLDTEKSVLEALKRFGGPQEIFGVKDITKTPRQIRETGRYNYLLNQPGTTDITAIKQEKEIEMDAKLATILRDIESDWVRTGDSYKTWVRKGGLNPYKKEMRDLFGGKVNSKEASSINARLKRMAKNERNLIKMYENRISVVGKDSELGLKFQDRIYVLKKRMAKKNADTTKAIRGASRQIETGIVEPEIEEE